ncbi:response regulator transcription factor [Vibrio salinus]|uniref:response regulator transcription factor n=1 Tax=Vibrio salinus TaxID=2899784 RepID=UPI001E2C9282|nr:AraC family transcriptional regulator [Vibrio salinus]MCE0495510.1 AraC family transcriptional regulator [Vibrio salinus]
MYNIVIVEDEPIELESLHSIISQCVDNVVLYEASTGKKAIQLINELQQIDMMLVDINIPLPNGKEVIEYLKTKNQDTKVVVTTANDDFDIVHSMFNLRVEDYLLKPVKKDTLTDTIKKTLGCSDHDIATSKALKNETISLIENCDYTGWHQFLFSHIDSACEQQNKGEEISGEIVDILEIINYHISTWEGKFTQISNHKINPLILEINRYGINEDIYSRLVTTLLNISRPIFDFTFKSKQSNMDFIERAKFHIEKNIMSNITLDDIAEKSYVSSCYLSRAFKKNTGVGFSNYVTERKIAIARSLLQYSDLKVNTIALELSWQDSNYFCRIFKKETGMAPSDYRQIKNKPLN